MKRLSYGFHGLAPLGGDIFSSLLPDLKLFTNSGAGTDMIEVSFFTENGVYVANTPSAVTKSTADGTALFILSCIKNQTAVMSQAKSAGEWRDGLGLMEDPEDLTLGIIGMGKIGQMVAQRMRAFGMTVVYHKRSKLSAEQETSLGVSYVSMDELLSRSDVISLNCPLTPETRHIINADTLEKAKNGVMIVNTARGGCVDTAALIAAIESGKVSRAGLDVFEKEPIIDEYFKTSNKVAIFPHYLAFTKGTLKRIELELMENVDSFEKEGKPRNAINSPKK